MSEKLAQLGNVGFDKLDTAQKTEVAKLLILTRPDGGFSDKTAIEAALGTAITTYNGLLVNVNAASDQITMKTALESIASYFEIEVTDEMAQTSFEKKGDGYTSVGEIITALGAR